MDEPPPSSSSSQSRKRPPESLGHPHSHLHQIPSNNYKYSNSNNKSSETASSQSSGEKTREDVNIIYMNSQHATTTTAPSTPAYQQGGDFNDDQQLIERALQESKLQYKKEQQKRSNCENEQLERAMRESLATASSSNHHHHRQQQQQQHQQLNDDIILIDDDDDDDDDDRKLSAKQSTDSAKADLKMPTNNNSSQHYRDDDLERAIKLSLEEQSKPKQEHEFQQSSICCRVFSREEFEHTLDSLINKNDGFEKIEKGKMVKKGNKSGDVKSSTKQSKAQYGRYMTEHMWQVFDVLEGKISPQDTKAIAAACKHNKEDDEDEQTESHTTSRLGSKITAFVDIGHGIGIQVMMAAWSLNVFARGIELMEERNEIAKLIRDGIIDETRQDPPDETKCDFRQEDLMNAGCMGSERDEELRQYLLFQDKPVAIQQGLVIFVNNAEEVFASRANDTGCGASLDEHIAELFGNMKVGGRMVTLTDIRVHLTSKEDAKWYHYESFDSGVGAVSWSPNKSVKVHVLIKTSDDWICSDPECILPSAVVDVEGKLTTKCVYCDKPQKRRIERRRQKRRLYTPEDGD